MSDHEHGHTIHVVDQIMSRDLDMTDANRSMAQADGYRQKYIPLINSYSKQVSNQQQQMQMYGNPYQQFQPHFFPCCTCGLYGDLSKKCPQQAFTQQNHPRNATPITTPS